MPYLETPIINSSSPGTKGNFPSCFGGKQTKAFSADRRTWTMKIHNRKYVYLGRLDQHHCKPCSDSAVCGLPTAHALTQSLNVMWNILGGDWTLGGISLLGGWPDTGTGFLDRWLMPQTSQVFKRHLDNALNNTFNCLSALKWSVSWTGGHHGFLPAETLYSILFCSTLNITWFQKGIYHLTGESVPVVKSGQLKNHAWPIMLHWPKVIYIPHWRHFRCLAAKIVSAHSQMLKMSSCCMINRHSVLLKRYNQLLNENNQLWLLVQK